ncbi:DUF6615 family protein [Hymenobacter daeguensis]
MPLCHQLNNSAKYVRQWFNDQYEVKEESMSDWLLHDISVKEPAISYHQFNRHEESYITGADWEWWFILSHTVFFSALVQAKKLFPSKDNYYGITHRPKPTKKRPTPDLQIKTLRAYAQKHDFAALYAFYSLEVNSNCPTSRKTTEGVFITSADIVHRQFVRTRRRKILPSKVIEKCIPLSCMLCCQLIHLNSGVSTTLPDSFSNFLFKKFGASKVNNNIQATGSTTAGFRSQLPAYIADVLSKSAGITGDFPLNRDATFPACSKVLITDLRNLSK